MLDQVKIGQFIASRRKLKNMTQAQLAEKLGVSDRTIGNWENARCMPELSLFEPLCNELDITINDLMSGEVVMKEQYQKKLEENMINTIDYSVNKIMKHRQLNAWICVGLGIALAILSFSSFPSESSWGSVYSQLGAMITTIGVALLVKKAPLMKKIVILAVTFVLFISVLFVVDAIGVIMIEQAPRFRTITTYKNGILEYKAPFFNVYRINKDTKNEYYLIDTKRQYTIDTVPVSPFNQKLSGFDTIQRYNSQYMGDNSNFVNLVHHLPLAEHGLVVELDTVNLGATIHYHMTDWYIEPTYLESSLIYNSVSLFLLIDNLEFIEYSFSGSSYTITRDYVETNYPQYDFISTKPLSKEHFTTYLENKMNEPEFVEEIFTRLFEK